MSNPAPRMRVLCVVASSNQLYSGIGRALFECAGRLRDRVDYTFAIDDRHERNVDLLVEFGWRHRFTVDVGRAEDEADALDPVSANLPGLLARDSWDAVECVCWADAATHDRVLQHLGDRPLFYTPHHQPSWTVAMLPHVQVRVEAVHRAMQQRSDLVLCDSPWERDELRRMTPEGGRFAFLPLGSEFPERRPMPFSRRSSLLFVGDLAEPRKRFDRVLGLLDHLGRDRPDLRLTVVGNRSDTLCNAIPAHLRDRVDLRGYISESDLQQAYSESLGLVLLSDYEAFGIPNLESLAAGTPVFLSRQPTTESLFGDFRGAHFCPAEDAEATGTIVRSVLARGDAEIAAILADRPRLRAAFHWDALAERKARLMAAAWSHRRLFGGQAA
jgi:glycosyltransferase involved in cell wall biosynthesis